MFARVCVCFSAFVCVVWVGTWVNVDMPMYSVCPNQTYHARPGIIVKVTICFCLDRMIPINHAIMMH